MKGASFRLFILPLLLAVCTLFYYFGELVDWAAWDALRNNFLYGVHDIHRLLFLAPIIYASYTARIKGAAIVTLVSFIIFLPRAFFISPYPDPLLRMVLFTFIAGVIGYLVARLRNEQARSQQLEAAKAVQMDRMLNIINLMADGILITGPDYRIRFMNPAMVRDFGEGAGVACYEHLKKLGAPCPQDCKILEVINNREIKKWDDEFKDGRTYEVVAAPFIDTDGTVCQISIFRDVAPRKNSGTGTGRA